MPDLLFLAQRLPYPPNKGEKIRAFHELRHLSRYYNIHLGCLTDDRDDIDHVEALRPFCRSIHVAPVSRRMATWNCLRGLLGGEALSVAYFRDAGLANWVRDVIERVRPAVTFVYSSNMAPYVLDLPHDGRLIADLVDVDSEKWRVLADVALGPMRWIFRREQQKIAELEQRTVAESDVSLFVSDAEAAVLARGRPGDAPRICGMSNGVDHRQFDPGLSYESPLDVAVPNFVFTGTMDYRPNIDAVCWFATQILPLIRRDLPEARFCIVGSHPAPRVRRLGRQPGVIVTGRVPDIRPYMSCATACVAPMRIARGIQNKVLEAMSMARPVVLTSGALEGLTAVPGSEILLADTPTAFAAACIRLTDKILAATIGTAARARIVADYNWDVTLGPLDRLLRVGFVPTLTEVAP